LKLGPIRKKNHYFTILGGFCWEKGNIQIYKKEEGKEDGFTSHPSHTKEGIWEIRRGRDQVPN